MSEERYTLASMSIEDGRLLSLRLADVLTNEDVEVKRDAHRDGKYLIRVGSENGGVFRTLNEADANRYGRFLPNEVTISSSRYGLTDWLHDQLARIIGRLA